MVTNSKHHPLLPQVGHKRPIQSTAASATVSSRPKNTGGSKSSVQDVPNIPTLSHDALATGKGGGALRPIDQKFEVNPCNGTMSLELPLHLTKARSSFQPSLSLSYNSGGGNGPFGLGWQLSLETITRKTSQMVPTYGEKDVFILSGSEDLVPLHGGDVNRDGYIIRGFRPRVDTASMRIEMWTKQTDPDDVFWRTISGDNTTKFFGRTTNSRIMEKEPTCPARIFSWLICEAYDSWGNSMFFSYKSDDSIGISESLLKTCELNRSNESRTKARYIKSIKYGNVKPSRDLDTWKIIPVADTSRYLFEVVFDYGEHDTDVPSTKQPQKWKVRQDSFSTYSSGFEVRSYRLCRRILMFHHFPQRLELDDYLVSSHIFKYDESPRASFLTSMALSGHIWENGAYTTEMMAPFTFEYSKTTALDSVQLKMIKPTALQSLPDSGSTSVAQWVDIHGEGSQGLLVQSNGAWYYQRNESAVKYGTEDEGVAWDIPDDFGPISYLKERPNIKAGVASYFEDLNGNGHQDIIIVDEIGRAQSFYESLGENEWSTMHQFPAVLNFKTKENVSISRVDLTGSGRDDMVLSNFNTGEIVWYESLGKQGYGSENRSPAPHNMPRAFSGDDQIGLYFADLSGDGLADCVRVTNGSVSYWPNLGYGKFGDEVYMDNSPYFDSQDSFSLKDLHLLDLDGSGTTDLVYVSPARGAIAFHNFSGNSWSDGIVIDCFPRVDSLSSVFPMDVLGQGVTSLCWVGSEGAITEDVIIKYLDLASKPHLLKHYDNGRGLSTSVSYCPSTKFYLLDERKGRPWKTKLPFPVQTVRQITEKDIISQTSVCTKFSYHDGFYDGEEREFRGFGSVDKWETERFVFEDGVKAYAKPTLHSKLWFHTGAPGFLSLDGTFGDIKLHSKLPQGLNIDEIRDAYRAMKGCMLRSETYGLDNSKNQEIPHSVGEFSTEVFLIQHAQDQSRPAIFRTHSLETLSLEYERNSSSPRIEHELVLEVNLFGDVISSAKVHYGVLHSTFTDGNASILQETSHLSISTTKYAKEFDENDYFTKPTAYSTQEMHFQGRGQGETLLQVEKLKEALASGILDSSLKGPVLNNVVAKPETWTRSGSKETRLYFLSTDLSHPLGFGAVEPFSVPAQSFELALVPSMIEEIHLSKAHGLPGMNLEKLKKSGGYIELNKDGKLWKPSQKPLYGYDGSPDFVQKIEIARSSFFTPTATTDPFKHTSQIHYDHWWILPVSTKDAAGNIIHSRNNYRTMQPEYILDPNKNRMQARLDALGEIVALAKMGKKGELVGDSMGEDPICISTAEACKFLKSATREQAFKWLGMAGTRWIRSRQRTESLPVFEIALTRTKHPIGWQDSISDIEVTVTYFNGRGAKIQEMALADWDTQSWAVTSCSVPNRKGNDIKSFIPYYSSTPIFNTVNKASSPSTISFFDALDRQVGTLNPDHSWSKTTWAAWSKSEYDEPDNIKIIDPCTDPDLGFHFSQLRQDSFIPSWYEMQHVSKDRSKIEAADKSLTDANNSKTTYVDCLDRSILVARKGGSRVLTTAFAYDSFNNITSEWDSLHRLVQRQRFDLLGKSLLTESMEAGAITRFFNCHGKLILEGNSRSIRKRTVYDMLERPIEHWVMTKDGSLEYLSCKTTYGETVLLAEEEKDNLRGRVASRQDQSGEHVYAYDFKGNCTSQTTQLARDYKSYQDWNKDVELEDPPYTSTTTYDALNRAVTSIDCNGTETCWTFRTFGGIKSVQSSSSKTSPPDWTYHIQDTQYNADGTTSRVDYGNHTHSTFLYDPETQLLTNKRTWRDDGVSIENIKYTYDLMGRVSCFEDTSPQSGFFTGEVPSSTQQYWYDEFQRLVKATGRESVSANGNGSRTLQQVSSCNKIGRGSLPGDGRSIVKYTETFEYDDADNLLSVQHDSFDEAIAGWKRTYGYEEHSLLEPSKPSNRLSWTKIGESTEKYGYDNDAGRVGCLTLMPGYSKLGWDSQNKMQCSARQRVKDGQPETTWFVYDYSGKRIRKVTERSTTAGSTTAATMLKQTIYLGFSEIYCKYNAGQKTPSMKTKTSIIYGISSTDEEALVSIESTTIMKSQEVQNRSLSRYHVSNMLEVNDTGLVISYEEYSPFGLSTLLACQNGIKAPRRHRFATYRRDLETGGMYACGARYYAPWLGRWISPDPIGTLDGSNLFAYVGNDPVNHIDPGGNMREDKKKKGKDINTQRKALEGITELVRDQVEYSKLANMQKEALKPGLKEGLIHGVKNSWVGAINYGLVSLLGNALIQRFGTLEAQWPSFTPSLENAKLWGIKTGISLGVGALAAGILYIAKTRPEEKAAIKAYNENRLEGFQDGINWQKEKANKPQEGGGQPVAVPQTAANLNTDNRILDPPDPKKTRKEKRQKPTQITPVQIKLH